MLPQQDEHHPSSKSAWRAAKGLKLLFLESAALN
jgi:hypothetical protein